MSAKDFNQDESSCLVKMELKSLNLEVKHSKNGTGSSIVDQFMKERIGAQDQMNSIFEEIVGELEKVDDFRRFYNPVTEAIAPGYFKVVRKPMDLSTILVKIKSNRYHKGDDFLDDVKQMRLNSFHYNGNDKMYTPLADKLLDLAQRRIAEKRKGLLRLERVVEHLNRRSSGAKSKSNHSRH